MWIFRGCVGLGLGIPGCFLRFWICVLFELRWVAEVVGISLPFGEKVTGLQRRIMFRCSEFNYGF